MLELIALVVVVLILAWYVKNRLPANYPPTPPTRLPLFGHSHYLLFTRNSGIEAIDELFHKYSKDGVMAFHLGSFKLVIIGSFDLLKECFKAEDTNFRQANKENLALAILLRRSKNGNEGIIEGVGRIWTEQRRFMLSTFKDFGFGKSDMERMIKDEVVFFLDYIEKSNQSGPIKTINMFNTAVLNILWQMIAGERFDYDDKDLKNIFELVTEAILAAGIKPSIAFIFPWLRDIFPNIDPLYKNVQIMQNVKDFLDSVVQEHRKTFDPYHIRDFIDAYLLEMEKTTDVDSSFCKTNGDEMILQTLIDLFFAGSETTSSTLSWAVLYLIINPEVQTKIHEEIKTVIGLERTPDLADRADLPYLDASILEIQRLGDTVPNGLMHANPFVGFQLGKYYVPQGHTFQGDFSEIMQDPEYWPKPEEFKPERHINDEGEVVIDQRIIPFSIGKRKCPGETLAKSTIFLVLALLLQRFEIFPIDPNNPPPNEGICGITRIPKPFSFNLKRRS
uniref:Cytochrome P450 CYP3031A1 n=1 Tax=Tigriopus kingsejongensis TaxID=1133412 RepID=A0A2H4FYT5_9MAXI|nr:cytochrome P450 CYP3031A1 [Tigriopus kingsejongensis]